MPISSSVGLWILLPGAVRPRRRRRAARPDLLPARGRGGNFAVGSSVTASSVARRRLISSRMPGGFLEVEVGGGGAHAGFEVGEHRLEIVADGGGILEFAGLAGAGARSARGRAHRRC